MAAMFTSSVLDRRLGQLLNDVTADVRVWRRHLHEHPELSFREHRTADFIASKLRTFGLEPEHPTETSVVATLRGGLPGRMVAVRADTDALPIHEETGLPFASATPGVMHACGHDGHVAAALGVAAVLSQVADAVPGDVRFLFQHAEEQMPKGAPELIDAGALDGVDVILGQHLVLSLPVGAVSVKPGVVQASADSFSVVFTGHGGHGAIPHETTDPIPATADFIHAVQRLAAREFPPQEPVIISVTQLHAGDAYNIIPTTATLGGTTRALSSWARAKVIRRIRELAVQIAALHDLTVDVRYDEGPPPVVNDQKVAAAVAQTARDCATVDRVTALDPAMGGDDYAFYLERVPGVYIHVGADPTGGEGTPFPAHHPRSDIDERALAVSTEVLVRSAVSLARPEVSAADSASSRS
jgi:amidohydrolase